MSKDVIVLGAGAAGLFCAIQAGKRGRSVTVLERSEKIGKKIRISGGGRCNFTNLYSGPENFLSDNPHFCKSALARFTPQDFIALVEKHGIAYHEKKLGQLFCDKSSEEIIQLLQRECEAAKVEIVAGCNLGAVAKTAGGFQVETSAGAFQAKSLVVATGGLSIPKMGATPFGHRLAEQFGLALVPPRPALVPLTWNPQDLAAYADLTGLSIDCEARCNGASFRENLLFTHRGLSGPAILQISSYWKPGDALAIDLFPERDLFAELMEQRPLKTDLAAFLSKTLPKRFAAKWLRGESRGLHQYNEPELKRLAENLKGWTVRPHGTEGYDKAEVTAGGVDTRELSSKTMEARKAPGLYFIGEAVDVTGHLGGHNFQWAWASGFAAGQFV